MPSFDVQVILRGDHHQLGEAIATLAMPQAAMSHAAMDRHQLATQIYRQLIAHPQLDTQLLPLFAALEAGLTTQIAQDDCFYSDANHPLRRTLNAILPAASHWYGHNAKPSQQFYERLNNLLSALKVHWENNTASENTISDFCQWLASEDKRAALLESRLCETELGTQKLTIAQTRVVTLINNHLAQRPLPLELHSSIALSLTSELQYWAFNTPAAELKELPLWTHWLRILPSLGQVFSQEHAPVNDQQLYSQIPALLTELERSLAQATNNSQAYQQLVDQLSQCLMMAIQKQPQPTALFIALPLPNSQTGANTKVPLALLQATESVKQGDWILMRGEDNNAIRCKLAFKNPAIDQLLFVDHTGRKVMSKTNKDFALCLSTGLAQPLRLTSLSTIIEQQLTLLITQANQCVKAQLLKQKQKAEALVRAFMAEQALLKEAVEQERTAELARLQAEQNARQAAADKALAEARLLAAAQQRRAAAQAAEQQRINLEQKAAQAAETAQRANSAAAIADTLQVGAWLEMNNTAAGTSLRAKLSVIIGATGKYIFADQVGRKIAEYTREQLVQHFMSGQLKIVRNGDNFEEQLAKVIRGLRRDVN